MAKPKSELWQNVDELVQAGKAVVVTVPASCKVDKIKKPRGRPRVNPPGNRLFGQIMLTPSGKEMRCRNPGCPVKMRKYEEAIVCSERCRVQLYEYCSTMLDILEGRMRARDLPLKFRSSRKLFEDNGSEEFGAARRERLTTKTGSKDRRGSYPRTRVKREFSAR